MNVFWSFIILIYCFDCQEQFTYKFSEHSKRKLEEIQPKLISSEWQPLRIQFQYLSSNYNQTYTKYLTELLEMVSTFFYRFIQVRRLNAKITFKDNYPQEFYGFQISQSLRNQVYDADIIIFVHIENSAQFYKAYCGPTVYDEQTLRPIMALMSWNMNYTKIDNLNNIIHESNLESAIHETIHGLGITQDYFSKYYDSVTGKKYEHPNFYQQNNITYLSTPRLLNFARLYFNCSQLRGIQMENNGGPGTSDYHFERLLLYNEIMTGSQLTGNLLITDFTFQLLQDTGFYRLSDYNPDKNQWGRNKGCDFVEKNCKSNSNFTEFCYEKNVESCSYERTGQSICMQEILSGECMYQQIYTDQFCKNEQNQAQNKTQQIISYYGSDSICLSGSISKIESFQKFTCQKFQCDVDNKLKIIIDDLEFDCTKPGPIQIPKQYFGNLECPNNSENICLYRNDCLNSCSMNGFCINKECICQKGYSGRDCGQNCYGYRYQGSCLENCPNQTFPLEQIKYCIGCPGNCLICSNFNQCTGCKQGYLLRDGFCDNYLLNLLMDQDNSAVNDEPEQSTIQSDSNSNQIVISAKSTLLILCIYKFMLLLF